jgi:inorganic pyrophosphatase
MPTAFDLHVRRRMNLAAIPAMTGDTTFHVVVESPRGSALKLKYEPRWQTMTVSRPLTAGLAFPFDWGFIPSTEMPDGDPLDAMLVWDVPAFPGVIVEVRALGVLQIEQNRTNHDRSVRVRNDRVLCVPMQARQETLRAFTDLPPRLLKEYEQFALAATALEGKDVEIIGWGDATAALELIRSHLAGRSHGRPSPSAATTESSR